MVQFMESHIEDKMYGLSYKGYKVWRLIERLQCMETYLEAAMYGDTYGSYNVCRLINRYNVWRNI